MNKFIKVTDYDDGTPIYIKTSTIISICGDFDNGAIISTEYDDKYFCKETPEEVLNLLKD